MDFRWSMRALLVAMDRWAREGDDAKPPASRYGRVESGTLVSPVLIVESATIGPSFSVSSAFACILLN